MRLRKKFRGRHKFVCQKDGKEYYSEDKRIQWDGLIVYKKNLDQRHPQDFVRAVKEDVSVKNPSPEGEDTFISVTYADTLTDIPESTF